MTTEDRGDRPAAEAHPAHQEDGARRGRRPPRRRRRRQEGASRRRRGQEGRPEEGDRREEGGPGGEETPRRKLPRAARRGRRAAAAAGRREPTGDELRAVVEGWSHDPHARPRRARGRRRLGGAHPAPRRRLGHRRSTRTAPATTPGSCTPAASSRRGCPRSPATTGWRSPTATARAAPAYTVDDPYRWLPTLGELDQHLIREGRHERLWEVLGAHVRRYDTPRGRSRACPSPYGRPTPAA